MNTPIPNNNITYNPVICASPINTGTNIFTNNSSGLTGTTFSACASMAAQQNSTFLGLSRSNTGILICSFTPGGNTISNAQFSTGCSSVNGTNTIAGNTMANTEIYQRVILDPTTLPVLTVTSITTTTPTSDNSSAVITTTDAAKYKLVLATDGADLFFTDPNTSNVNIRWVAASNINTSIGTGLPNGLFNLYSVGGISSKNGVVILNSGGNPALSQDRTNNNQIAVFRQNANGSIEFVTAVNNGILTTKYFISLAADPNVLPRRGAAAIGNLTATQIGEQIWRNANSIAPNNRNTIFWVILAIVGIIVLFIIVVAVILSTR